KKALDQTPVPTIYAGEFNYLKQGLYWDPTISSVGVLVHDRTIIGTTMADVAPELLPPPPTPAVQKTSLGFSSGGCSHSRRGTMIAVPILRLVVFALSRAGCTHVGRGTMISVAILGLVVFALRRRG